MNQPLWQNLLNITLIGFVAQRAALGVGLYGGGANGPVWGTCVALLIVCAFAGIAVWLSTRWVIAALLSLALAFTLTVTVELAVGGTANPPWLIGQLLVAWAGTAALVVLARRSSHES